MRLSELRGVLTQLEYISHQRGNIDPIVEMFHQDGETVELNVNLVAINADPEGQVTKNGSIHLPLMEIETRGYVIVYFDKMFNREDSIIMQAESKEQAKLLFEKYFSTYTFESITEEV